MNLIRSFLELKVAIVAVLCTLVGCSGQATDLPETGYVSGVVTMDGKPMTNALVVFQPRSGGRNSMGKTDKEGRYELNYNGDVKGAILGEHKVVIQTAVNNPAEMKKETIPAIYNSRSLLLERVDEGDNNIDFSLDSNAKPTRR